VTWRGDVRRRRSGTGEEKRDEMTLVELTDILMGRKIMKIHKVNLAAINER
jgi:hypothetical protein